MFVEFYDVTSYGCDVFIEVAQLGPDRVRGGVGIEMTFSMMILRSRIPDSRLFSMNWSDHRRTLSFPAWVSEFIRQRCRCAVSCAARDIPCRILFPKRIGVLVKVHHNA